MHPKSVITEEKRLAELSYRFRKQYQFALDYSPLYAALFGSLANLLTGTSQDPVVQWLLRNTTNRAAFDVTNLLAAGLHYKVLGREPEVSTLAAYYPTVGGNASPERLFKTEDHAVDSISVDFALALRKAILTRQEKLSLYLQSYTVQTNETGRGIAWLLPASLARWDKLHLVDLGASAGLNLIADRRAFQFVDVLDSSPLFRLGQANTSQFTINVNGKIGRYLADKMKMPKIGSRTGYDIHPFHLKTADDERILTSFIWADQIERVQRLAEAVTAFHQIQRTATPVRLFPASLPDDLAHNLHQQPVNLQQPLLIYNTYIKMYLPGKGKRLHEIIARWAVTQKRPVIWIQWEPPLLTSFYDKRAPELGWLAWTADLWHNKQHRQFHLGWVHPHGRQVQWLPDMDTWILYWSQVDHATV